MSCQLIWCTTGRVHHHHTRAGVVVPNPCLCTRPETIATPTIEQLLDFAAAHPGKITGRVDEALRAELRITPVRYLQLLQDAIQTEEAAAHDPLTTHRLRREAEHRARIRAARTGQ